MPLISPGVEVTVIDESNYIPASTNSVPFFLVATAQNKISGSGIGVAAGTLAANAGRVFLITSQRDLAATFGNPFFYKTAQGTPINGYELNEYGLLAAYSALGISNRAYVQRANVDLTELTATLVRPTGNPDNDTYWLDTVATSWGIFQWNQTTGAFTVQTPTVITNVLQLTAGIPSQDVGSIGGYAVVATNANNPVYYKNFNNVWVEVGSDAWKQSWPTVQGANSVTGSAFTVGNQLIINEQTITIGSPQQTLSGLVTAINSAGIPGVTAETNLTRTSNKLVLYADSDAESDGSSANGGLINIEGVPGITQTFVVTAVTNPGTPPPNNIYQIDGVNNPVLSLVRGGVYTFDQSAASNAGHPIAFKDGAGNAFTTGVVSTGTPGQAGAQTVFTVPANAPDNLRYYCVTHGNGMGNTISVTGSGSGSTSQLLFALGITAGTYLTPELQQSANFTVPRWRVTDSDGGRPTGSIWNITTAVNQGADIIVKKFDAVLADFVSQSAPIFANDQSAIRALDPARGGLNIPAGTLYTQFNTDPEPVANGFNNTFTLKVFERLTAGVLTVIGDTTTPVFVTAETFTIQFSTANSSVLSTPVTVTLGGTSAAAFVTAVSAALPSGSPVSAAVTSDGAIAFGHSQGGVIVLNDVSGTPVTDAGFSTALDQVRDGVAGDLILSNWVALTYTASANAPSQDPAEGRQWYYSEVGEDDIMIQNNGSFVGYRTVNNDVRGFNLTQTDPAGPIVSTTAPTQQSDQTPLVQGDIWINTTDLELYPDLYRWQELDGVLQWVPINNTDQTTENGILFQDARWAPNGITNPITDPIPSIVSLLSSSYLDIDAPDASLFPEGMLLFNTRRSGFNVKSFQVNYFNATDFAFDSYSATTAYAAGSRVLFNGELYIAIAATQGNAPSNTAFWADLQTNAWVTVSGNRNDGSPFMGRQAVRQIVVAAMKSAIDTQDTLREEQVEFNLLACPQYPELIVNMVALNNERSNTGFVVGDTPLRLPPTGTAITAWANNAAGASDGESGLNTADAFLATFYPSCQTTDLSGSQVVQPPSHMMIRTIIRSDEVSFPWLAPAGVRRGVIDNAERIGYVDGQTGEFITIATGQGLRDTLYENRINPITFIPGVGITNYGQKTAAATPSTLDRINVARLVAFLRGRLEEIGKTFVFEPNDQITRNEISNAIDGLMVDLVAKRGIYDYLVVCDESNNTPARIDRNELYVDIAIEPVKAVEFIFIPLRIKNTGEITSGEAATGGGGGGGGSRGVSGGSSAGGGGGSGGGGGY